MPAERLHLPFLLLLLVAVVVAAAITGSTTGPPRDRSHDQPRLPAIRSAVTHRPHFSKMLTEYALTLAEFPCPLQSDDARQSILVVQEPCLSRKRESNSFDIPPYASLLWFLKCERGQSFTEAAVLGYVAHESYHERVWADVAFDAKHGQFWVALIERGSGHSLDLKIYSIDAQAAVARSRSFLVETPDSVWPPASTAVAFQSDRSSAGFGVGNAAIVTSLSANAEVDGDGSHLVVQVHTTSDFNNKLPIVKLWTWRYAIDRRMWSSRETEDVPRPEPISTERDNMNQARRAQWAAMIEDAVQRRMLGTPKLPPLSSAKASPP